MIDVRSNWTASLRFMEDTKQLLSKEIDWGFTDQDLLVLCCLHEANKYRSTIEDLLTDCNFHTECSLLEDRKYDECRKRIIDFWRE